MVGVAGCAGPGGSSSFSEMLDQLPATLVEDGEYPEVVLVAANKLPNDSTWQSLNLVALNAQEVREPEVTVSKIGIDTAAADAIVRVLARSDRRAVSQVVGSQDANKVREAATANGYSGDDVLTAGPDAPEDVASWAAQVQPMDDRVYLGGSDPANFSRFGDFDGDSLLDVHDASGALDCLGDPVAVMLIPDREADASVIAIGVAPGFAGGSVGTVCLKRDTEQWRAEAETLLAENQLAESTDMEQVGEYTRLTVTYPDKVRPITVFGWASFALTRSG